MLSNAKQADSEKDRSSPATDIRPLSEAELQRLESALGKPVDRQYLTHWVSQATRDVARLSILPPPQQLNIDLRRLLRLATTDSSSLRAAALN
jgi:hypothetical protein